MSRVETPEAQYTATQVEESMRVALNSLVTPGSRIADAAVKRAMGHITLGTPPELYDILDGLSSDYAESVERAYGQTRNTVITGISEDRITRESSTPGYYFSDPNIFADQIKSLAPIYTAMQQNGWEPASILVPTGWDYAQWRRLLINRDLPHDFGRYPCQYSRYDLQAKDDLPSSTTDWELAVTCGNENPPFTNISADAQHGYKAKRALNALRRLPVLKAMGLTDDELLKQFSPSVNEYFALQVQRLLSGELPVDNEEVATLCFDAQPDQNQQEPHASWYYANYKFYNPDDYITGGPGHHTLQITYEKTDVHTSGKDWGVRPCVAASDVLLS